MMIGIDSWVAHEYDMDVSNCEVSSFKVSKFHLSYAWKPEIKMPFLTCK